MTNFNKKLLFFPAVLAVSVLLQSCLLTTKSYVKERDGVLPVQDEYSIKIAASIMLPGGSGVTENDVIKGLNSCNVNRTRFPSINFVPLTAGCDGEVIINFEEFHYDVTDEDRSDEIRQKEEEQYAEAVRKAKANGESPPEEPDYTTRYIVTVVTLSYSGRIKILTNEGNLLENYTFARKYTDEFVKSERKQTGHKTGNVGAEIWAEAAHTITESLFNTGRKNRSQKSSYANAMRNIGDDVVSKMNKYFVLFKKRLVYLLKTKNKEEDKIIKVYMSSMKYRRVLIKYLLKKAEESTGQLKSIYLYNLSLLYVHEKNPEQAKYYYIQAADNNSSEELKKQYKKARKYLGQF